MRWHIQSFAVCSLMSSAATAQYTTQTFTLSPGWNAIYLELAPADPAASAVFSSPNIEEVWSLEDGGLEDAAARCEDPANPNDPTCTFFESTRWRIWLRNNEVVSTLRIIQGGRGYLVSCGSPSTLHVFGKPAPGKNQWSVGMNFTGFHVDPQGPSVTFADFLTPSPLHDHNTVRIFSVESNGSVLSVPRTAPILVGRAYFVSADAAGSYDGPLLVDDATLRGIDYALTSEEHSITVENLRTIPKAATIAFLNSDATPEGGTPLKKGAIPLDWLEVQSTINGANRDPYVWHQFDSDSATLALAAGGTQAAVRSLRVAVDRVRVSAITAEDESYQGLLSITDGAGYQRLVPVSAQRGSSAGLWVGSVTVNAISWVTSGAPKVTINQVCDGGSNEGLRCTDNSDCGVNGLCVPELDGAEFGGDADVTERTLPLPTQTDFSFPLILHYNGAPAGSGGEYKMLMEVAMLWKPGDPVNDPPIAGEFVLATPECTSCDGYGGAALVNGQQSARRIGSAAYAFSKCELVSNAYVCERGANGNYLDADLQLSGDFDSELYGEAFLPFDHPLNPFLHRFHPDHDTLTVPCNLPGATANPSEGYDLVRTFTFTFFDERPRDVVGAGWGHTLLAGTYREELRGVVAQDPMSNPDGVIVATGRFQIRRVSAIANLNGG